MSIIFPFINELPIPEEYLEWLAQPLHDLWFILFPFVSEPCHTIFCGLKRQDIFQCSAVVDIDGSNFNFLFGLVLYIPVNSYGHVGTDSSPNYTYFLSKLD